MSEQLLTRQQDLAAQFANWFAAEGGLKAAIDDNRRRYRMKLADEEERRKRGLSALPSTKSAAVVDGFVIDALMEYHGEPDAISYTAKDNLTAGMDEMARWLTEIVKYRMEHTFPFQTWHMQSLKAGAADGMEAALVSWRKESFSEPVTRYYYLAPDGSRQEIAKEVYELGMRLDPERYQWEKEAEEVTVRDTWWIDQLKPGDNLLWDFKNPILDLDSGEWAIVILQKTVDEIKGLAKRGVFDKISAGKVASEMSRYQGARHDAMHTDAGLAVDPETIDTEGFNRVPVWLFFEKKDGRWLCSFSADGELPLSSVRPVSEVFYAGRKVNRLPVVLGCNDFELWQPVGRGLPKLIAPVEDEITDARNNANDYAKQLVQGRWRIRPDTDIDLDAVLNGRAFFAEPGDVERMDHRAGFMESLRISDGLTMELHELAPMGLESRSIVPKGTSKTLGAARIQERNSNKRLASRLLVRNETFFKPLLYLIAQLEFSFETDELVLRIAGSKARMKPPMVPVAGMMAIDLAALDFEVNVQINAGLGNVPKEMKAQKIMQIAEWRRAHGIPTDLKKVAEQLNILAGFNAEQFDMQGPMTPPPPPVEYKANVSVDLDTLPPEVQMEMLRIFLSGQGSITANIKEDKEAAQERREHDAVMSGEPPDSMEGPYEPGYGNY